ncbi:MAG: VanW family protein [Oscillospiraceae bacterium]|nr:VanW family protein [Oscillospiraceae bacterium]
MVIKINIKKISFLACTIIILTALIPRTNNPKNKTGIQAAQGGFYTDILAQTSTPLKNNTPNRRGNIILACEKINGTVLEPDAVFSFNQTVGRRDEAFGFKSAPSFADGHIKDSVGGGICQVSSTLYYACLLSNLEIEYRKSHSMCPDYLERPGLDATVDWGAIDYKFKNNTGNPIKILSRVEDTRVYVKIIGTKTNGNTVAVESVILSALPFETIYRDNAALAPGDEKIIQPPFTGYVTETYRVVTDKDGKVISRVLEAKDSYKKLDQIIERGP